jgi:chemotaxis signal transduction protein
MSAVNAWLLDLGGGLHGAVGDREMIHVLPDPPTLHEIPQSPGYCRQVLVWQGEVLPLMDLAKRLSPEPTDAPDPVSGRRDLVGVAVFQRERGEAPQYGCLLLRSMPARIAVSDADACELPDSLEAMRPFSVSCFSDTKIGPVPVLDLHRVFSLSPEGTNHYPNPQLELPEKKGGRR